MGKTQNMREMITVVIAGCCVALRPLSGAWTPFCVISALRLFIKRHWGRNKPGGDHLDTVYLRCNALMLEI